VLRGLRVERAERFPSLEALLAALSLERRTRRRRLLGAAAVKPQYDGFSLHADVAVHDNDRQGLERPCRYGLRPTMALSAFALGIPRANGADSLQIA